MSARLLTLISALMASLAMGTAVAQETAPESTASGEVLEQVTVTGTRIVRDGYETPTPVTVLGADALDAMAVTNIADAVNRLPMFAGSLTPRNSSSDVGSTTAGVNFLNLRSLGANRTLVLLDGKRVVGSSVIGSTTGAVDINAFPNGLIERVEVVTGGASAVYGSDALAGVVNFVLDTDYTGFKSTIQGGTTTHGDGESFKVSFTAGTPFAEGRGHFLFNGEHAYQNDIKGKPRDWAQTAYQLIINPNYTPTNGQPQLLTVFDAGLSVATPGGLIVSCPSAPGTACPLRGTRFLAGGVPTSFDFGPIVSGIYMSGGDAELSRMDRATSLGIEVIRDTAFARASYDVSDSTTVFASLHWSSSEGANNQSAPNFNLGGVTVLSGNPFIPASVQAQMTARGIPSFTMGTTNADMPYVQDTNARTFERYVIGANGEFGTVDSEWRWDAYYSRNTNEIISIAPGMRVNPFYTKAVDAVLDDNGHVVCRVNADTDPSNNDTACFPYNPMGIGVNSQSGVDYVTGTGHATTLMEQDVVAISVSGEPFSSWAGPVSLAAGAEHRREQASGTASELDEAGAFLAGNFHATVGKYDVTEGFLEAVVPLANDQAFAEELNVTGAMRWTDYSTSGEVVTWKLGTSWMPIEDVRFRVTRSRDIRAPSLGDLFSGGQSGTGVVTDPFNNGVLTTAISRVHGNPNLEPEEADTTGIGVVFTPSFLPGFAASIDYYEIEIEGAIVSIGSQESINRCFAGETILCSNIQRDANGFIETIARQPVNILAQTTNGFDLELSYRFPLSSISNLDGDLAFRALATYVDSLVTRDSGSFIEGAGVNTGGTGVEPGNGLSIPDLRYFLTATYDDSPFTATLTMRGTSSGVYSNAFIECVPGACPAATAEHPTINNNHIDAVEYFDLAFNYTIFEDDAEVFFVVQNLLDEDPPLIAGSNGGGFHAGQSNMLFYDRLGRKLSAGIRIHF